MFQLCGHKTVKTTTLNKSKFLIEAYENQVTHSVNIKIIDRIGNEKNSASDIRGIVQNALEKGIKKAELFISSGGGYNSGSRNGN